MLQRLRHPLRRSLIRKRLRQNQLDIENGWTVELKESKGVTESKRLANFVAWPVREILLDDGISTARYIDIQGLLVGNKRLPTIRLSDNEFLGDLKKSLPRLWGIEVIIKRGAADRLREAIQVLGKDRQLETIYTCTGWRNINDQWVFLHAGGAVAGGGVRVDLSEGGENLSRYVLPLTCDDQEQAASKVFSLFGILAPHIAYPMIAITFLSPLCSILREEGAVIDFVPYLVGRSQNGKSVIAGLFLSFFGDFDKNSFPAKFNFSISSIEKICFILRDVLTVVDDYFPAQTSKEQAAMKEVAQHLARAYGDSTARGRMGAGGRIRQSWFPRGAAVATGEIRPDIGESGLARYVFIDVTREHSDYEALLELQSHKRFLAEFMVIFLEWVASNRDRIPALFQETYRQARSKLVSKEYSGRINESVAKLFGGLEVFFSFAKEQGFIGQEEYERHGQHAFEALKAVLEQNAGTLRAEMPSQMFLAAMAEIVASGQGHLCATNAAELPEHHFGCYDNEYVYLFPSTCYKAAKSLVESQGKRFPIGDKMLWRHLRDEGIIETSSDARHRNTVQKRLPCLGGNAPDVLKLKKSFLGL
jgi:hypothetical protein